MNKEILQKVNYYANKKKKQGLTKKELEEQKYWRQKYLEEFKKSFKKRLENIDIEYID